MGKFVIKQAKNGLMFNLKANNGEVIATSEIYTTRASCLNGIKSIKNNAPIAAVEDQTVENFEKKTCPKFELYTDKSGKFRFRLKAKNGQIVAVSEAYGIKKTCENGIDSVRRNFSSEITEEKND